MHDRSLIVSNPQVDATGFDSLAMPTYRGSTIAFASAAEYEKRGERGHQGYSYGLYGTPTTRALEQRITLLEQGARTFLLPSGQAASALAILALVEAGDTVLIADNIYPPVRDFAERDLKRFGVRADYVDPLDLDDLGAKLGRGAKLVWLESPGSTTMEVADLPAIVRLAHGAGALVGIDNTWASPLAFKPLAQGADLVAEALTKHFSGHSDVILGSLTVRDEALILPLRAQLGRLGIGVSPDDAQLVLRGMETMALRMEQSARLALAMADWLQRQPVVQQVLYPPLPGSPGHALWARDFHGASGVFSVVLQPSAAARLTAALDGLERFTIGASWGGTRSLVAPMPVARLRSARRWPHAEPVLRLSIGLEAEAELWADLQGLVARLAG